jgi:hypothetical protein
MAGLMALPPSELRARAVVFLATGGVPALFESRYEEWLTGTEQRGRPILPGIRRRALAPG